MRSTGSMLGTASWMKISSCGDRPRNGPQEAGWYIGVQVRADAVQEDGPDNLDLCDCTDYVERADKVGPVWW